jgi:hypothetical protein
MTGNLTKRLSGVEWVYSSRSAYTYDDSGNRMTGLAEEWNNGQWEHSARETYTYDGSGGQLTYLAEIWEDGQWVNSSRETNTYDGSENQLTVLFEEWYDGQWRLYGRWIATLDDRGRVQIRLNEGFNGPPARETFTYDATGNILAWLWEDWRNGQWEHMSLHTNTYDVSGDKLEELHQSWENGHWRNWRRGTYTYGSGGGDLTEWSQSWKGRARENERLAASTHDESDRLLNKLTEDWESGQWQNYERANYTYDASGNLTTWLAEAWDEQSWGQSWGVRRPPFFGLEDSLGNVYELGWVSSVSITWKPIVIQAVNPISNDLPVNYSLSQNYPNPFNPSTTIEFALPNAGYVTLKVYNVLGEEVATVAEGDRAAGIYRATWDASDMPSGVCFYRLTAGDYVQTKKAVLMR